MYEEERMFPFWNIVLLAFISDDQTKILEKLHEEDFMWFDTAVKYLEERGYVKKFGPNPADITLRKHGEDLIKKYIGKRKKQESDVHTWIDAWREIFPEGSSNTGYRYRGNRLECLKKMTKFVNSQKGITKEEIFKATKLYVERFAIRGYMYMHQAHYFIEKKDVGSTLASEIESLKEGNNNGNRETGYGERII
jgi:hypothetical protein